jgi:hypothetical protein
MDNKTKHMPRIRLLDRSLETKARARDGARVFSGVAVREATVEHTLKP